MRDACQVTDKKNTDAQPPESKKIVDQDTELIEKINSGKQELFEQLVVRYEQKLYNFGFRMCGDASDAEDLVQETFLNTFNYLKVSDLKQNSKTGSIVSPAVFVSKSVANPNMRLTGNFLWTNSFPGKVNIYPLNYRVGHPFLWTMFSTAN